MLLVIVNLDKQIEIFDDLRRNEMSMRKEKLAELKDEIKQLAQEQKEDKAILRQPHNSNTWKTMCDCYRRAMKITAYLNFYNEVRGKEYRHSTEKYTIGYTLEKTRKELQDKYWVLLIQESQVVTVA